MVNRCILSFLLIALSFRTFSSRLHFVVSSVTIGNIRADRQRLGAEVLLLYPGKTPLKILGDICPLSFYLSNLTSTLQDGLFDCAWSEESEPHLVSVCGDGSIKVILL